MTQTDLDFELAIKDLREIAPDMDIAEKISKIADRLVDTWRTRRSPPQCIGLPIKPEVIPTQKEFTPTLKDKQIIKTMHLKYKYPWDYEDPEFPRENWRKDVNQGNTFLGYFDWIIHKLEG